MQCLSLVPLSLYYRVAGGEVALDMVVYSDVRGWTVLFGPYLCTGMICSTLATMSAMISLRQISQSFGHIICSLLIGINNHTPRKVSVESGG